MYSFKNWSFDDQDETNNYNENEEEATDVLLKQYCENIDRLLSEDESTPGVLVPNDEHRDALHCDERDGPEQETLALIDDQEEALKSNEMDASIIKIDEEVLVPIDDHGQAKHYDARVNSQIDDQEDVLSSTEMEARIWHPRAGLRPAAASQIL